jgi:IclR family transcriptional regulator, acetate operon repressor
VSTKQRNPRGRPKSQFTDSSASTMQSLDRALAILTSLAKHDQLSLTDISLSLGIPTATTHRILATLQKNSYAEFDEATQKWAVGIEAYRTGSSFLNRTNLLDVSRAAMRALMELTGETANLAISDGFEVVFVGQVETQNPIRAYFNPGTRTPVYASGIGKAILAAKDETRVRQLLQNHGLQEFTEQTIVTPSELFEDLEATRQRGWSYDREERYDGMSCIGAAIYNIRGEAIAGISVSGPSSRFTRRKVDEFGPMVAQAADEITRDVGGVNPATD